VNCSTKKAFTLIELVISIVIIAIASVSLPMMLSSANKLEEQTINQDIFYKSTTVMNDIFNNSWDKIPENTIRISDGVDLNTSDANSTLIWYLPNPTPDVTLKPQSPTLFRYGSAVGEGSNRKFYSTQDISDTTASAIPNTSMPMPKTHTYINQYNDNYLTETQADGANVRYDIAVRYVDDNVMTDAANPKRQTAVWYLNGGNEYLTAAQSTNLKRVRIVATRNIGSETMNVGFSSFIPNVGNPGLKTKK